MSFEQLLLSSFLMGSLRKVLANLRGKEKIGNYSTKITQEKVCHTHVQTTHVKTAH